MRRFVLLLGLLLAVRVAHAEPTARFADIPNAKAAPAPSQDRVREPAPKHESWARSAARERVRRAVELVRRGDSQLALAEYGEAIRLDPSFGEAYLGMGALREALGDLREAERVYDLGAKLPSSRASALDRRARVRRALGRQADAFADLESSVALEPNPERLKALAEWYVERRTWPAALVAWRRLLSLLGDEPSAARDEARVRVKALSVLAADSDPVVSGTDGSWVRRSLANIAKRAP